MTDLPAAPESSGQSLSTGSVVGSHRIVQLLDNDYLGQTYLVENVADRSKATLRLLQAEMSTDPRFAHRFDTQMRTLKQVRHPNIAAVLDAGQDKESGRFFVTTAYSADASGRLSTLQDAIVDKQQKPTKIPEPKAREMALQLCSALDYLHGSTEEGFPHGNICPADILVEEDGTLKLKDCGLAWLVGESAFTEARGASSKSSGSKRRKRGRGSKAGGSTGEDYLSPEQKNGESASVPSDIYSLGVVLHRILSGVKPSDKFKPPSSFGVAKLWDEVVAGCRKSDADKRYASVSSVQAAISGEDAGKRKNDRHVVAFVVVTIALVYGGYQIIKYLPEGTIRIVNVEAVDPSREAASNSLAQVKMLSREQGFGQRIDAIGELMDTAEDAYQSRQLVEAQVSYQEVQAQCAAVLEDDGLRVEVGDLAAELAMARAAVGSDETAGMVQAMLDEADALRSTGLSAFNRGDFSEAQSAYIDARSEYRNAAERAAGLARVAGVRDDYEEAYEKASETLSHSRGPRWLALQKVVKLALESSDAGNWDASIAKWRRASGDLPGAVREAQQAQQVYESSVAQAEQHIKDMRMSPARAAAETALQSGYTEDEQAQSLMSRIDAAVVLVVPDDYPTIRSALAVAAPRAILEISEGRYAESLSITSSVALIGIGERADIILESSTSATIVSTGDRVILRGLTVRHTGRSSAKSALSVSGGRVRIDDCDLSSASGSGCDVGGATAAVEVRGSSFHDSQQCGLIAYGGAKLKVNDCEVYGNALSGVQVSGAGTLAMLKESRLHDGGSAGMLILDHGKALLQDCRIFANASSGVEAKQSGATVIKTSRLYDSERGSGVFVHHSGDASVSDCEIYGNANSAVEVADSGTATLESAKLYDSRKGGVFVHTRGSVKIHDCEIYGNMSSGIQVSDSGSVASVSSSQMRNGSSVGVLVSDQGKTTMDECEIYANALSGVEVRESGDADLIGSRVYSSTRGPGVFVHHRGEVRIGDCEVYSNAHSAVEVAESGSATLTDSKLYDSSRGGVLVRTRGRVKIDDCSILGNRLSGVDVTDSGGVFITGTELSGSTRSCGVLVGHGGKVVISDSDLNENAFSGIEVMNQGSAAVTKCRIKRNAKHGVYVHGYGRASVSDTTLLGNQRGAWNIPGSNQTRVVKRNNIE